MCSKASGSPAHSKAQIPTATDLFVHPIADGKISNELFDFAQKQSLNSRDVICIVARIQQTSNDRDYKLAR